MEDLLKFEIRDGYHTAVRHFTGIDNKLHILDYHLEGHTAASFDLDFVISQILVWKGLRPADRHQYNVFYYDRDGFVSFYDVDQNYTYVKSNDMNVVHAEFADYCSKVQYNNFGYAAIFLTEKQRKIVDYIINSMDYYAENGYGEGYSDITLADLCHETGWDTATVKGTLGTLIKQGAIEAMDVNQEYNVYYASDVLRKMYGLDF